MAGFLSKLFGGGGDKPAAATAEPVEYKDFSITPDPIAEGGEFRIAAVIEKDGKRHQLIRADTTRDRDAAVEASLAKAQQMIDEQGERLFG